MYVVDTRILIIFAVKRDIYTIRITFPTTPKLKSLISYTYLKLFKIRPCPSIEMIDDYSF